MTGTYQECVSAVLAAAKTNGHNDVHEHLPKDKNCAHFECSDCCARVTVHFGNTISDPQVVMEQNALINEKCVDVAAGRGLH